MGNELLQCSLVREFAMVLEALNQHVQREVVGVEGGAGGKIRGLADAASAQGWDRAVSGNGWWRAERQAAAALGMVEGA